MDPRRTSVGAGQRVAVLGAAGHTGRFVVAELRRLGFRVIAVGRDGARLAASGFPEEGVELRTASLEDPASLDRALAGAEAILHCAGPFLDTAEAVTEAALRAGVHYLDLTAEQASARATLERCGTAAREAGVVLLPAMGFFGGFGDLLATAAMGDWESADELRIGIALDSWHPTRGTRRTGRRNTARRLFLSEGALTPLPDPEPTGSWDFPEPFGGQGVTEVPLSETILIARHLRVSRLHNYLNDAPLADLHDPETPPPAAADESGRSAQRFLLDVRAHRDGAVRRVTARGRDIYAFTAPLVVEAVGRVLAGEARKTGALAPGEAFDAVDFLQALAPWALALEIHGDGEEIRAS